MCDSAFLPTGQGQCILCYTVARIHMTLVKGGLRRNEKRISAFVSLLDMSPWASAIIHIKNILETSQECREVEPQRVNLKTAYDSRIRQLTPTPTHRVGDQGLLWYATGILKLLVMLLSMGLSVEDKC